MLKLLARFCNRPKILIHKVNGEFHETSFPQWESAVLDAINVSSQIFSLYSLYVYQHLSI